MAPIERSEAVKQQFRRWDTKGDGLIGADEFARVFKRIDATFPAEGLELLVKSCGTTEDGKLNYNDFIDSLWAGKSSRPGSKNRPPGSKDRPIVGGGLEPPTTVIRTRVPSKLRVRRVSIEAVPVEIIEEWREAFDLLDAGKTGKISMEDMQEFLADLEPGRWRADPEMQNVINEIDKTGLGDGIDFESFCSMMNSELGPTSLRSASDEKLQEAFALFDQDKDGLISADELWLSMEQLFGQEMDGEEFDSILEVAGMSYESYLNFEDFKKLMNDDPSS